MTHKTNKLLNKNELKKHIHLSVEQAVKIEDSSSPVTLEISKPILSLYRELLKNKLPLDKICETLDFHKKKQIEKGMFSQNFFTLEGSSNRAIVKDTNTNFEKEAILWCVNHYTGLNKHPKTILSAQQATQKFGTGSGTSAMSCGHTILHKTIEKEIALLLDKEDALFFPTGYSTNLGTISALANKNDLIIFDRECHASIIDGIKLSQATFVSFKHNNLNDLEKKIVSFHKKFQNIFIIVESAYSMSGDIAPLKELCDLKNKFRFFLYVDEAHTFGIYGKNGAGLCSELNVTNKVDFIMSTLSKSTASVGGFVACKKKYKTLLEWAANSYIFQAATSPADCAAILTSIKLLKENPSIAALVHTNNKYMRNLLTKKGFDLGESQSPIIPIYIPDDNKLLAATKALLQEGVFTVAVVYPAVKSGEGRLRFIVTATHTKEDIQKTVNAIDTVTKHLNIDRKKNVKINS